MFNALEGITVSGRLLHFKCLNKHVDQYLDSWWIVFSHTESFFIHRHCLKLVLQVGWDRRHHIPFALALPSLRFTFQRRLTVTIVSVTRRHTFWQHFVEPLDESVNIILCHANCRCCSEVVTRILTRVRSESTERETAHLLLFTTGNNPTMTLEIQGVIFTKDFPLILSSYTFKKKSHYGSSYKSINSKSIYGSLCNKFHRPEWTIWWEGVHVQAL